MKHRVVLVVSILTHYRSRFHELVKEQLAKHDILYEVVFGTPLPHEAAKCDTVTLSWAIQIPSISIGPLLWQPALHIIRGADLVIVTQENRLLLNYWLQLRRYFSISRTAVAFFGHGRNFQARLPKSGAERWKRFWATKVDWWFAYTNESRRHVEALGYPPEKITVFNNSVDIQALRNEISQVTPERLEVLRKELGLAGRHVGVFVGGLYPDKRLEFLAESTDVIREIIPDFELLVIGGGPDLSLMEKLANHRPWIHILGPRFGLDKVETMLLGHVFMMPGLVGLAILDAGAVGLPIATTNFPWHSPEIAYLTPNENGLLIEDWKNPVAYGKAVADLLNDTSRLNAMATSAEKMSLKFSIEEMAENFTHGVLRALNR